MKKLLRWPAPVIFILGWGMSIVAAWVFNYDPTETGQQVLTTLASVQAAVFAIVFSVIILGIQLSTSRYSARLADLFRSDSVYKTTVGIFAGSLAVNVATLLVFSSIGMYALRMMVFFAVILSIVSFVFLYAFIDYTLEQTTPEGIIKRIKRELTPQQIIEDAKTADDDPSETDPFLVPVSIVRSAIDDRDSSAATQGLNVIDTQVDELLEFASTDDLGEETAVGNSLEELSAHRLPNVGEKTVDEDMSEVGSETVNTVSSIGKTAVHHEHEHVAVHNSQGLGKLIATVDFDTTGERIRKESIDQSAEMLQEAAEAELWDATGTGVRILGWRAAQSVIRRGPTENYKQPYTTLTISDIPDILEKVVEGVPSDVSEEVILDGLTLRDGEHASPPEEWALWCCYAAMTELTSAFIRYELDHNEEIVGWARAGNGWTQCIKTLDDSDFDSLLRLWLGTLLYVEYIESEIDNEYLSDFYSSARYHVSKDVLFQTIDDILEDEFDPTSRINLLPGRFNPIEMPRTGHPVPPVSNPDRSFKQWLNHQKNITPDSSPGWGGRIESINAKEEDSEDDNEDDDADS